MLKGADIHMLDQDGDAPIHKAILYGHVDAVEAFVLSGSEIDITNGSGYTPLHVREYTILCLAFTTNLFLVQLAVYSGLSDIARVLLQSGSNFSNLVSETCLQALLF